MSAADILLSLTIFILAFPLFVTLAFLIHVPQTTSVNALVSSSPTRQGTFVDNFISLLVFQRPSTSAEISERTDKLEKRQWHFRIYEISYVKDKDIDDIRSAINNSNKSGSIIVQTRGPLTDLQVFESLREMLKSRESTKIIRTSPGVEGFYQSYEVWQVTFEPRIQFAFFWRTYAGVLKNKLPR